MNYQILDTISGPETLKHLTVDELNQLADEIRHRIINVLSITGGHLASNLGSLELTIALHRVFNSPEDKFIWDVSHQTYTHKILTGRNDRLETIRQYKGLCGFSNPKESPHDHFHAGHAGTALSLALGMAKTRDLNNRNEYIIPIIGDATLTCGMSLEAFNNVSRDMKRFVVILNDNEMSISKNVGQITNILSRMVSNPTTNRIHQELDSIISRLPGCGGILSKQGRKVAESLKNLFSSAAYFEQFGLSYLGPFDGHNIGELISAFERIKDSNWPVVLHLLTNKGQGMEKAIENPVTYHGAKPFCPNTGKFLPTPETKPTFPKVFGKHLLSMAEEDSDLVVVTPAMSAGSCLDGLMEKFPDRCIDVGIAEAHAVTYCGGIAHGGDKRVVCSIYSTFLQRGFDNLFHDVCLQELPVVFALDRGGIAGGDGVTHNGIYDISFLNAMPNMVICQPRNGTLLRELLNSAFSWERPTAIRYPNLPTEDNPSKDSRELGKGEVLAEGSDILIITLGHLAETGMELRSLIQEQHGITATLMDAIFVKPLDTELLCNLLATHQKVITIEEHSVTSGLGVIINSFLMAQGYHHVEVVNCGIPEAFIEHGKHSLLMDEIGLTPKKILKTATRQFDLSTQPEHVSS
ncbi:MAG: 1-deoxy-D-xylulose-5-phosphate synthase [Chlamydiales bacterium]|nr:1-deoxy-D-xylulose-5-phosphate synthase [Chlamydiia bacterium]MCP5508080.1 1-deoxy-D-xylulose-5-phosphate synthase [Chlamydiales bacterium]